MNSFERYEKGKTEPFVLSVISKSFDSKYDEYNYPEDTDNFDFISPDDKRALEVVFAIPQNEINTYTYEKALSKNSPESKKEATKRKIKEAKFDKDGNIIRYYGGSIQEIIKIIKKRVA